MKPLAELFLKPGKRSKKMIRESAKWGPSSEHGATGRDIYTRARQNTRFKVQTAGRVDGIYLWSLSFVLL